MKKNYKIILFIAFILAIAFICLANFSCKVVSDHNQPDTVKTVDTLTVIQLDTIFITITDTTVFTDTFYMPEPEPVFNQIPARTSYTLSWTAEPDSTMGIFLIYDAGLFNVPSYLIKTIDYPESTCTISASELNFTTSYQYARIYMKAQDMSGNMSMETDTVSAIFAKNAGMWGDLTGTFNKFDASDFSVMEYFINIGQYNPAFDFCPDGKIDSLDFKIVRGE